MPSRIPNVHICADTLRYFKESFHVQTDEELEAGGLHIKRIKAASKLYEFLRKSAAPDDVVEAADFLADELQINYVITIDP